MTQNTNDDFVPAKPAGFSGNSEGGARNYPVPKSGSRRARVSLIIDIGTQIREDSYKTSDGKLCNEDTPGAIATPQKPAKQVVVFADLVHDTVDYGGDIGKAQYRLLLNGSFAGVVKGINHANSTPPLIKGGIWTMHPQNLLTKLAKATLMDEVVENAAINRLLGKQFMAQVEVNEKASGKNDENGDEIIYRNVNFKGASQVASVETGEEDDDGNPIEAVPEVAALKQPARCVTFANAKEADIMFIRPNIIKMIKLATDYAGSNMQKAIEAHEAKKAASVDEAPAEKPAAKPAAAKVAPKPVAKPKAVIPVDDDEEASPF